MLLTVVVAVRPPAKPKRPALPDPTAVDKLATSLRAKLSAVDRALLSDVLSAVE